MVINKTQAMTAAMSFLGIDASTMEKTVSEINRLHIKRLSSDPLLGQNTIKPAPVWLDFPALS